MKMRWSAERLMRQTSQPLGPIYCLRPGFMTASATDAFFAWAMQRQERFEPSTVQNGKESSGRVVPRHRSSRVFRELGELGHDLREQIRKAVADWAPKCGVIPFVPGRIELELTSSGDGDFFRVHRDDVSVRTRVLSYVCFLHREPKRFEGGELHLYSHDLRHEIVIEPLRRSMVVFQSSLRHQVQRVRVHSGEFADSRLTVNGWIHSGEE